jgi:AAA domain (Cdc48 subfamily)
MQYSNFLSHADVAASIIADGESVTTHILGETGIGKTAVGRMVAKALPTHRFSIIDATQVSDGSITMPTIDNETGVSDELPNVRFGVSRTSQRGVDGSQPIIVFIDEYNKASKYAKNALAPVIYERRLGHFYLPDGSIVILASNLGVEGYGDTSQMFLKTREATLYMRKPTADELVAHAVEQAWEPEVASFIHEYPQVCDSFMDYSKEYGGKYAGRDQTKENAMILNPYVEQDKIASPRTLEFASHIMRGSKAHNLPLHIVRSKLIGTVGESCALEMMAYFQSGQQAETFERVVADPMGARLSDNPTVQLIQLFKFLSRVSDRTEAEAVTKYMGRCRNEMQVLFTKRVSGTPTLMAMFITVAQFGSMMRDNRDLIKV